MSTPESPVSAGSTRPAGEDISDEEAIAEVSEQTAPDRKAEDVFERESEGTTTDAPAEDANADDLAD